MRRTKQWWIALTKLERSELHALEHSHSYSVENYPDDMQACGACGVPTVFGCDLCFLCTSRRCELIKKADNEILGIKTYEAKIVRTYVRPEFHVVEDYD